MTGERGVIRRDVLDAIGSGMRFYTGESQKYKPSDMITATDRVYERGYIDGDEHGYADGYGQGYDHGFSEGVESCEQTLFSKIITGDGTDAISFNIPFAPDCVSIACNDADLRVTKGILTGVLLEPRAIGQIAGVFTITTGPGSVTLGTYSNTLVNAKTVSTRITQEEDGTTTIKNLYTADETLGIFASGVNYIVTASKTIQKTDKERITEALMRLPADPAKKYSVHIRQDLKNAAFTEEEWKALIAKDPINQYSIIMW